MNNYELIKFKDNEFELDVNVSPEEETVWLSKEDIGLLFGRDRSVITKHINNIYKEGELIKESTCAKNAHMPQMLNRYYETVLYNLDVIISVGYRVKSKRGVIFRKWASNVLKQYLLKGYVLDSSRIIISKDNYIQLEDDVRFLKREVADIKDMMFVEPIKEWLIYQGQRVEADVIYQEIYSLAKKSLYIIDDYIGPKTVMLLKHVDPSIDIKIFSDDVNKEKDLLIEDYYKDTKKVLEILPTNNVFHDRYIIIDYRDENEKIFHSGPSSKDAGNKVSSITQVEKPELYHCLIDGLVNLLGN